MLEPDLPGSEPDRSSLMNTCKVCKTLCDPYENPAIQCVGACSRKIHIQCLRRGGVPSPFVGDVFFNLTCSNCDASGKEVFHRKKMSWSQIIILALYNLRAKSSGISKRGYFHWKSDISAFVDRNWELLFTSTRKQPRQYTGTISGILSHHTDIFFKSGSDELKAPGWWKLISNDPPEILMQSRKKFCSKNEKVQTNPSGEECPSPAPSESSISLGEDSNSAVDSFKTERNFTLPQAFGHSNEILSDFLLTEEDLHDMDMLDTEDGIEMDSTHQTSLADLIRIHFQNQHSQPDQYNRFESMDDFLFKETKNINRSSEEDEYVICDDMQNIREDEQFPEDSCGSLDSVQEQVQPSLFTVSKPRAWPWEKSYNSGEKRPRISEREEAYLLQRIKKRHLDSAPPSVKRLYRKLSTRKLKREYSLHILDVDQFGIKSDVSPRIHKKGNRVLDRFFGDFKSGVFEQRLQGHVEPISVHSPYTNRLLKPFIRRDTSAQPLWLKVMDELCAKANKNNPKWKPKPRAPIDYSYIRPQHIPALNSLCNQFFWPGIDLTECLQYPDFSCVVLYKKLVIGFAVLVPDVGYNQAYVSFFFTRPEWRRSGIGTFMLYHLIQTCMGKDVTLHVSVTNPALILYQKFGFKVEEFIQDFYDKYMSSDSRECKHALFLRLSR